MADALNWEPVDGFFMVWTKGGTKPRVVHGNRASALAEAGRLAGLNPGRKYLVLAGVEKVWTETLAEPGGSPELPA